MLQFSIDGPYPGFRIWLDRPFTYQLPMLLFQAGQPQLLVSSDSVKEQLSALPAEKDALPLAGLWASPPGSRLPEKVPKKRALG